MVFESEKVNFTKTVILAVKEENVAVLYLKKFWKLLEKLPSKFCKFSFIDYTRH